MNRRHLKRGERVPAGAPRRYIVPAGYVLLRWIIAPGEAVQAFEHRIRDGRIIDAARVHHRNGNRADNRRRNLEPMTRGDFMIAHQPPAYLDTARRMRAAGRSWAAIGRAVGRSDNAVRVAVLRRGADPHPGARAARSMSH